MGKLSCGQGSMAIEGEKQTAAAPGLVEDHEFVLPSTIEAVATVEKAVEGLCSRAGFDEDTASNIAMVSREAAINAVKHGNGYSLDKKVTVSLRRTAEGVSICIADEGAGFDTGSVPDPLDPANLLRSSGRGVFLMRAIMDEIHFSQLQTGTKVTLIKKKNVEARS